LADDGFQGSKPDPIIRTNRTDFLIELIELIEPNRMNFSKIVSVRLSLIGPIRFDYVRLVQRTTYQTNRT